MPAKHIPVIMLMLLLLSACGSMQSRQQPQRNLGRH